MRRSVMIAVMLALLLAGTAQAKGPVEKVTGDVVYAGDFSLSISAHASAPAKGEFQATWSQYGSMQGTVSCVVIDGQDAWIAGMLTGVSLPGLPPPPGTTRQGFFLWVHDAGQPNETASDMVLNAVVSGSGTIPPSYFEGWCQLMQPPITTMVPVTSGNLMIHAG